MKPFVWIVFFLSINIPFSAFAQSELVPIWKDSFFSSDAPQKMGLISRSPEEIKTQTEAMEKSIRDAMYGSARFSVVKDGRAFPNNFDAADILGTQDLNFLCILDGYNAPKEPRFELNCFRKTDANILSFLGSAGELSAFVESKTFKGKEVVVEKKTLTREEPREEKHDVAKAIITTSKRLAVEGNDDKRLYFDPTRKDSRRILVGRKRTRIEHAEFYALVGEPQLKEKYLEIATLRTTFFIAGSVAVAAGAGLIFGGAISNAQCGNDDACKNDLLTILGGTTLGLGILSIATGFLINKFPTSSTEDKKAIDLYNENREGIRD